MAIGGDRSGYLPLSSGFTPGSSRGGSFLRSLFRGRKLPCVAFFLLACVLFPIYLLGPRLIGDSRMHEYGLDNYWNPPEHWISGAKAPMEIGTSSNELGAVPIGMNQPAAQPGVAIKPTSDIASDVFAKVAPLTDSHFPVEYVSKQDMNTLYPDGDPHLGQIPPKLLAMIEDAPQSQRPPRPLPASEISATLWKGNDWEADSKGSKTTFEDSFQADTQEGLPDWRAGTHYAGWTPPLLNLSSSVQMPPMAKVQFDFPAPAQHSGRKNDPQRDAIIRRRQKLVRNAFLRSWEGYKKYAWGHDELKPVSNGASDPFNGWGATIVDALDTLLVMDLPDEYDLARQHVRDIDFTYISGDRSAYGSWDGRIPVFETAIRFMGGLLSAYDLTGDTLMRDRAEELGQLIMPAFRTQSGVPIGRLRMGDSHPPQTGMVILSEATSLLLEFTRLWQVTGNRTYFDQVQRVTDWFDRNMTKAGRLGTLLPTNIGPESDNNFGSFSFGGMADSYYEYLIKEYQLLGGRVDQYKRMYSDAIDDAKRYLFSVIKTVPGTELVLVGVAHSHSSYTPKLEHLACFSGAMVGLGAKLLPARGGDMLEATRLTDTCYWAYNSTLTGIGPEDVVFYLPSDPDRFDMIRDPLDQEPHKKNPRGNPQVGVRRAAGDYRNRPETIESVFYMWRVTGDIRWQERGWQMFASWVTHCMTESGFSGIYDVNHVPAAKTDNMESFAFAETFKYYYLLFSPPEFISLDHYVFTTEAHPLLVPQDGKWTRPGSGPKKLWTSNPESQRLGSMANAQAGATEYSGGEGGKIGGLTNVQKHALLAKQALSSPGSNFQARSLLASLVAAPATSASASVPFSAILSAMEEKRLKRQQREIDFTSAIAAEISTIATEQMAAYEHAERVAQRMINSEERARQAVVDVSEPDVRQRLRGLLQVEYVDSVDGAQQQAWWRGRGEEEESMSIEETDKQIDRALKVFVKAQAAVQEQIRQQKIRLEAIQQAAVDRTAASRGYSYDATPPTEQKASPSDQEPAFDLEFDELEDDESDGTFDTLASLEASIRTQILERDRKVEEEKAQAPPPPLGRGFGGGFGGGRRG